MQRAQYTGSVYTWGTIAKYFALLHRAQLNSQSKWSSQQIGTLFTEYTSTELSNITSTTVCASLKNQMQRLTIIYL